MDYEKNYNEALNRARQFMSEHPTRAEADLMVALFPELAESEDEKIRGEIVHHISLLEHNRFMVASKEECLAYLEKQKEIPMPNSTELIEMWHNAKAMLKEKDFRDDAWRLAQNAFMVGFARGTCVKTKEQTPGK